MCFSSKIIKRMKLPHLKKLISWHQLDFNYDEMFFNSPEKAIISRETRVRERVLRGKHTYFEYLILFFFKINKITPSVNSVSIKSYCIFLKRELLETD